MRIRFQKAGEDNSDLDIIAVGLAALGLVTGWILPFAAFMTPACQLRRFTGIPCPGCGGTRTAILLSRGHLVDALLMNPLVAILAVAAVAFATYSAFALAFRLPRLRIELSTNREYRVLWTLLIIAAAADWIYLIVVGR
jgi:hypothetical protein